MLEHVGNHIMDYKTKETPAGNLLETCPPSQEMIPHGKLQPAAAEDRIFLFVFGGRDSTYEDDELAYRNVSPGGRALGFGVGWVESVFVFLDVLVLFGDEVE